MLDTIYQNFDSSIYRKFETVDIISNTSSSHNGLEPTNLSSAPRTIKNEPKIDAAFNGGLLANQKRPKDTI